MPRATLYIVDSDNIWLRRRGRVEPVLEHVVDKYNVYWIRTASDERGIPIWHIYQDDDLLILDSRPEEEQRKQPSKFGVLFGELIDDLNHHSI
jgi:hypothetical protein